MSRFSVWTPVVLLLLSSALRGQTGCGIAHTESGVFICYPNPAGHAEDRAVPSAFHLSAQANAQPGRWISRYAIFIDSRRVYQGLFSARVQRLSIETNIKSPFDSGSHTIRLIVDGTGSAAVADLQFESSAKLGFCDPFSRVDPRTCVPLKLRKPLEWSVTGQTGNDQNLFSGYVGYLDLYAQNLKSVEADVADAVAIDKEGNLYAAFHSFADIEVRKYARDGSLVYDNLIHSCGSGFVSITGIAVNNGGLVWVAGNTTACLPTTPNALETQIGQTDELHGFVMLLNTASPPSGSPIYVTYLSRVENRISAFRVDRDGNAYLTGTTESADFPHQSTLGAAYGTGSSSHPRTSFVSVLNSSGSGLRWSTLLPRAKLNAITIDDTGIVYITGRSAPSLSGAASADAFIATLSDNGRHLSYFGRLGGSGFQEGRAISIDPAGTWVLVAGDRDSPGFSTRLSTGVAHQRKPYPFVLALQPCGTPGMYSQQLDPTTIAASPEIATQPALDAFAKTFGASLARTRASSAQNKPLMAIQVAPNCPAATP